MITAPRSLFPLAALALGLAALGSIGCGAENKVLRTNHFTLNHPDYWKVQQVAQKDGDATKLSIGRFSTSSINEGVGAMPGADYERSQADVEVRIHVWPTAEAVPDPTKKVTELLIEDPELQLQKMGRLPDQPPECGQEFKRKYSILKADQSPLDLGNRPGHRLILVGGHADGRLVGVVARVPFEPDPALYCHNLTNMRTQLGLLLESLALVPAGGGPPPAPGAAPPPAPPPEPPKP